MNLQLVVSGYAFSEGKVLLILHKKLGKWLPPGGHIDDGETPDSALKREFLEELNLNVRLLDVNEVPNEGNIKEQLAVPFYVNVHNVGDHDHCCFFYLCEVEDPKKLKINEQEVIEAKWFSEEELSGVPPDVRNIGLKAFEAYRSYKPY